jgi:hypothetical protein
VSEDPEILEAIERRKRAEAAKVLAAKAIAEQLEMLVHAEPALESGLRALVLLLQAREMFIRLKDRPGITHREIAEFVQAVDELVDL